MTYVYLDKQDLKNLSNDLLNQALNKDVNQYVKLNIELEIPSSIMALLTTLSDLLKLDEKVILSKMASQGLNKIIQDTLDNTLSSKEEDPFSKIESMSEFSTQLNEIKEAMNKISDFKDMFSSSTSYTYSSQVKQK